MQTVDFAITGSTVWIVVLSVTLLVGLVVLIVLRQAKNTSPTFIYFSATLVAITAIFVVRSGVNAYHSSVIVEKIAEKYNMSDLTVTNHVPSCTKNFNGFLTAATWKKNDVQNVGVIFGYPIENGCQFILKTVS